MKLKLALSAVLISIALSPEIMPQSDVHLFQSFLKEAQISSAPFLSVSFLRNGSTFFNALDYNLQAGYLLTNSLEARLSFGPEALEKYKMRQTDASLSGIYNLLNSDYLLSAGAFLTLPLMENIRSHNVGYGIFGALKKPVADRVVLTADAGLDIRNQSSITKTLFLGAGAIIDAYEKLAVIAEGQFWAEDVNTLFMSGGVDYKLMPGISLRGVLGFNLLDTGEDLRASFGASYSF